LKVPATLRVVRVHGGPRKEGSTKRIISDDDNLAEQVPQLQGLHYTFDPTNNAIAIIDPRSNRVIALI
jgi:hypothetical protein